MLLTDDARAETGLAGLVDLAPDEAAGRLVDVSGANGLSLVEVTAQRWRRGGRHQA